jgi:hypothetical protein
MKIVVTVIMIIAVMSVTIIMNGVNIIGVVVVINGMW